MLLNQIVDWIVYIDVLWEHGVSWNIPWHTYPTKSAVWVVWTIGSVPSRACHRVDVVHRYMINTAHLTFPVAFSFSTYPFQRPLATTSSFRITSHGAEANHPNIIIIPDENEAQHLKDETGNVRLENHAWTTPRHLEIASVLVESSIETSTPLKRKRTKLKQLLIWYVLVLWLDACFLWLIETTIMLSRSSNLQLTMNSRHCEEGIIRSKMRIVRRERRIKS
jgi:hypothetical protein